MEATSKTSQIRQFVADRLRELGARNDSNLRETLLMRNGLYCGHRFTRGEFQAVWFVEEDQIKFFDAEGSLADRVQASKVEYAVVERQAA